MVFSAALPTGSNFLYATPGYNPDALVTTKGWTEIDRMKEMSAYYAPLSLMRQALLFKGWSVRPSPDIPPTDPRYPQAVAVANAFRWTLKNIRFHLQMPAQPLLSILFEMSEGFARGLAAQELVWRVVEEGEYAGQWGLAGVFSRHPKGIGFRHDTQSGALVGVSARKPWGGPRYDIPREKILLFTYQPEDGLPHGRGVARACYKHVYLLDHLLRFYSVALQRYGSPFIIVRLPLLATLELEEEVKRRIALIEAGGQAILPDGVTYEVVTIDASAINAFPQAIDLHADMIATAILGQSLTTRSSDNKSTWAQSNVQQDTQELLFNFGRRALETAFNSQVAWAWTLYNYGAESLDLTPALWLGDFDNAERAQLARTLSLMFNANAIHPLEGWIREAMGWPAADAETLTLLKEKIAQDETPAPSTSDPSLGDAGASAQGDTP